MLHNKLFRENIVNHYMQVFSWPQDLNSRHGILKGWITTLRSGALSKVKESSLQGPFLIDIFERVLGYTGIVAGQGEKWNLHQEKNTSKGGGTADGAIGFFEKGKEGRIIAPVELKDANTYLDRNQTRGYTPVQQGWRYASETLGCSWVIISNFKEIRLYNTRMTPHVYEIFLLEDLDDIALFKRFYFLLCAPNFLPAGMGESVVDQILDETGEADEQITNYLYSDFKQARDGIIQHLRARNPGRQFEELIEKAQKILDRIIFMCFCEDRRLLPRNIIQDTYNRVIPGLSRWQAFAAVFSAVDKGHESARIPGYNGGLFTHDAVIESLIVGDEICDYFLTLSGYNYDSEVTVNILGHIFEQSIVDLEEIRSSNHADREVSQRRRSGIFYTPPAITHYVAENSIRPILEETLEKIIMKHSPDKVKGKKKQASAWLTTWEDYRRFLQELKVLDPSCGSGAFLVAAFDILFAEYQKVNNLIAGVGHGEYVTSSYLDLNKEILNRNLFGVDISPESVEITKLSLWIKTAESGKELTTLDNNIKCGNSLINDHSVDPRAFDWSTEFPEVFAHGGFHVIIGNPPYIKLQNYRPYHPRESEWICSHYATARSGNFDMYIPFIERGLSLLHPDGVMGLIAPSLWLLADYGENLRDLCSSNRSLHRWVDFKSHQVFRDATTYTALQFFRKIPTGSVVFSLSPQGSLSEMKWSTQTYDDLGRTPWILVPQDERQLLDRLQRECTPLEDATDRVFQGLITGADKVFHLKQLDEGKYYSPSLREVVTIEDELMHPLISGAEGLRYSRPISDTFILFPYSSELNGRPILLSKSVLENQYPYAWQYFLANEAMLRSRERGRFTNSDAWWQFGRNQNLDKQELAKILVPRLVKTLRASADVRGRFYLDNIDVGGILPKEGWDMYFLLAVLNSPVANFVWRRCSKPFRGDYGSANKQYIKNLPIPNVSTSQMKAIAQLARVLTALHTALHSGSNRVERRISVDLLGGKSLTRRLRSWYLLSFGQFRNELQNQHVRIPLKERADWEKYLSQEQISLKKKKAMISRMEARMNARLFELYRLNEVEIALVQRDYCDSLR